MAGHNSDVSDIILRLADLREFESANAFRIRVDRNAASTIMSLPMPVADIVEGRKDLSKLPVIGRDLAGKFKEIVTTGSLPALREHH